MTWFRNHYHCEKCEFGWSDKWSSACDDDCPQCGARHLTAYHNDDLTQIVEQKDGKAIVLRSAETAEFWPDYREIK